MQTQYLEIFVDNERPLRLHITSEEKEHRLGNSLGGTHIYSCGTPFQSYGTPIQLCGTPIQSCETPIQSCGTFTKSIGSKKSKKSKKLPIQLSSSHKTSLRTLTSNISPNICGKPTTSNIKKSQEKIYRLNKPDSYKNILRQKTTNDTCNEEPPCVSGIRQKYEQSGPLSNAHKKYLNILGVPRVVRQGSGMTSIDPL